MNFFLGVSNLPQTADKISTFGLHFQLNLKREGSKAISLQISEEVSTNINKLNNALNNGFYSLFSNVMCSSVSLLVCTGKHVLCLKASGLCKQSQNNHINHEFD